MWFWSKKLNWTDLILMHYNELECGFQASNSIKGYLCHFLSERAQEKLHTSLAEGRQEWEWGTWQVASHTITLINFETFQDTVDNTAVDCLHFSHLQYSSLGHSYAWGEFRWYIAGWLRLTIKMSRIFFGQIINVKVHISKWQGCFELIWAVFQLFWLSVYIRCGSWTVL